MVVVVGWRDGMWDVVMGKGVEVSNVLSCSGCFLDNGNKTNNLLQFWAGKCEFHDQLPTFLEWKRSFTDTAGEAAPTPLSSKRLHLLVGRSFHLNAVDISNCWIPERVFLKDPIPFNGKW